MATPVSGHGAVCGVCLRAHVSPRCSSVCVSLLLFLFCQVSVWSADWPSLVHTHSSNTAYYYTRKSYGQRSYSQGTTPRRCCFDRWKQHVPVQARTAGYRFIFSVQSRAFASFSVGFVLTISPAGDSAVGKSSLVLRFVKGQFHEYQESTIGGTVCQRGRTDPYQKKKKKKQPPSSHKRLWSTTRP